MGEPKRISPASAYAYFLFKALRICYTVCNIILYSVILLLASSAKDKDKSPTSDQQNYLFVYHPSYCNCNAAK